MLHYKDKVEQAIVEMLYALWHSIDYDFKAKYARDIWRMFGDAVTAGARMNGRDVARFVSFVARKMQATPASGELTAQAIAEVGRYDGQDVMRRLRTETAYLVALTRIYNDKMKEQNNE